MPAASPQVRLGAPPLALKRGCSCTDVSILLRFALIMSKKKSVEKGENDSLEPSDWKRKSPGLTTIDTNWESRGRGARGLP